MRPDPWRRREARPRQVGRRQGRVTAAIPRTVTVPAGSCDAHLHVYSASHEADRAIPVDADVAAYAELRSRFGFSRAVVVQPRPYGTDNSVVLASIAALGRANTRGIAVVHPDVSDSELDVLNDGGVRGIRLSLFKLKNAVVTFDMVEPLARRVHRLGWHLQLHWTADQIVEQQALLRKLPTPVVFDHMARLPVTDGVRHPAFDVVLPLLLDGRAWVKLSGPYLESRIGANGCFSDIDPIAKTWIARAPDRLVWGSDWPQMDWPGRTPAEAQPELLAALRRWAGAEEVMRKLLVDNPAALYGFDLPQGGNPYPDYHSP